MVRPEPEKINRNLFSTIYTGNFFLHRKFLFTVVIHDAPVKSMLSAEKMLLPHS
jgi:hypothetical protein